MHQRAATGLMNNRGSGLQSLPCAFGRSQTSWEVPRSAEAPPTAEIALPAGSHPEQKMAVALGSLKSCSIFAYPHVPHRWVRAASVNCIAGKTG